MERTGVLLQQLTLEEKAALLEGYQSWMTNPVPRLQIPAAYLTDGPVGVRKKRENKESGATGLGNAPPATAFPTSVAIATSWSAENARKMGHAIGQECIHYGVDVLLAPALNIKRDPRCGRNFEYYSEDPYLAGVMAAAFTEGIQSTGTAACAKHFALNNCENYRYMSDSVADERAVREIYLKPFEICVKQGRPRTMMCSYNRVNGAQSSQNPWLTNRILREEWGFDGLVMTDWGATLDRVEGIKAGIDLDMPGNVWYNRRRIVESVRNGELTMEQLDASVARVLELVRYAQNEKETVPAEEELFAQNHRLAIELAADSAVLLKNSGILPLQGHEKLLVVGELFTKPRYQGAGSSGMNPTGLVSPKDAFDAADIAYTYRPGYHENSEKIDEVWLKDAILAAKEADTVLFFGGLTALFESEGFDRENLELPAAQLQLLRELCACGKKTVAVLYGGSAFEVPFADSVDAILHMFLPGQGGGEACRQLLYGERNPSGKLSESWMATTADIPYGDAFGKKRIIPYRENIYVGYRYYDQCPEKLRYPFGFGLSYTTFAYDAPTVKQYGEQVCVSLTLQNTGGRDGAEVVQLYGGRNENSKVFKAPKTLLAFQKVYLQSGESRRITLTFSRADLAYYNTAVHDWVLENGEYPLLIGASSQDIRLQGCVTITGQAEVPGQYDAETVAAYNAVTMTPISDAIFEKTIGRPIPAEPSPLPFTLETPLNDFAATGSGRLLLRVLHGVMNRQLQALEKLPEGPEKDARISAQIFTMRYIPGCSARGLVQSGGGVIQMNVAKALPLLAGGHYLQALRSVLEQEKEIPLPSEQ